MKVKDFTDLVHPNPRMRVLDFYRYYLETDY